MKLTKLHHAATLLTIVALGACSNPKQESGEVEINDSTTPLHLLQPDYKTPYGKLSPDSVKADIDRCSLTSMK